MYHVSTYIRMYHQQYVKVNLVHVVLHVYTCAGESEGTIKHTDPIPDPNAVNQDKTNMLFSVSL